MPPLTVLRFPVFLAILVLSVFFHPHVANLQVVPNVVTTCPTYVQELVVLVCECTSTPRSFSAVYLWPGASANSTLIVSGVTRSMDGKVYPCTMVNGDQIVTSTYTLKVAYGPLGSAISGPGTLVTNGSRVMELTCQAQDAVPGVHYQWAFLETVTTECESQPSPDKCLFRPKLGDQGGKVMCTAQNTVINPRYIRGDSKYVIALQYPPPTEPVITIEDSQEPLKKGDVIKCVVSGGSPLVSTVDFRCLGPSQPAPTTVRNALSITSTIVIETFNATHEKMLCLCSARWEPQYDLYLKTTYISFAMRYSPIVSSFSVNGTTSILADEKDRTSAAFNCSAHGEPAPSSFTINRRGLPVDPRPAGSSSTAVTGNTASLDFSLNPLTCEDSGEYSCRPRNGVDGPFRGQTVYLNITCAPSSYGRTFDNGNTPVVDPETGLRFTLRSNPPPNQFNYTFSSSSATCTKSDLHNFEMNCTAQKDAPYLADCHLKTRTVSGRCSGVFNAIASNDLGKFPFQFSVASSPTVGSSTGTASGITRHPPESLIAVVVVGILALAVE